MSFIFPNKSCTTLIEKKESEDYHKCTYSDVFFNCVGIFLLMILCGNIFYWFLLT